MSETAILWLFGTVISVQTLILCGIVGAIWKHVGECRDYRVSQAAAVATVQADLKRVIQDIGDHDSGMRGDIHDLRNTVAPFLIWAQREQEKER